MKKFCLDQAMRMSGLRNFPYHQAGVYELAEALGRISSTDRSAIEAVVDVFVESTEGLCPVPADIARAGWNFAEEHRAKAKAEGRCSLCDGVGWVSSVRYAERGPFAGREYTYAAACECRRAVRAAAESDHEMAGVKRGRR